MHEKEPGEPLPVKLIRSYMIHRIFWLEIHRNAISTIHQQHQAVAAKAHAAVVRLFRRSLAAHIGYGHNYHTFAWASQQAGQAGKIVMALCTDLEHLHLQAIALSDEVQVLNLAGYIDPRTLHELCAAYNADKPITWLEAWPMYCPACRHTGLESVHFFHNALSLHDLNELLTEITGEHLVYLSGQLADWYGQIVPVVLLPNGLPALQVDLACPHCSRLSRTAYAVGGENGAWVTLVEADGMFLTDLCDADNRSHALACAACAVQVVPVEAEVRDGE